MSTLLSALEAGKSALNAERVRIEAAVSNLANAESTRGPDGQPYRRRDVVLEEQAVDFDTALGKAGTSVGVRVAGVVEDQTPFQRVFQPSHPDADADGYVALPNVDEAEEMVNMLGAARAYQANLTAISLVRDLIQRALDIGK